MSNLYLDLLPDYIIQQYNLAISAVLEKNAVNSRFYFPSTKTQACTSCQTSTTPNPYVGLGVQRQRISCSVCNNTGRVPIISYQDLAIAVIYDQKKWKDVVGNFVFASDSDAQTISEFGTIKIIKTCKYVVFDISKEYANKNSYQRIAEPEIGGFGEDKKFIITKWKVVS